MHKKIVHKFIWIYVLIGVVGFILISTVGSNMIESRLIGINSLELYNEAVRIAAADPLLSFETEGSAGQDEIRSGLKTLAAYQSSEIWLLEPDGTILFSTAQSDPAEPPEKLSGFDPSELGSHNETVGRFFGHFPTDHLSVLAPIVSDTDIRGYVGIHRPMNTVTFLREELLNVLYILAAILYALFLLVFGLLYVSVLRPLKKITVGMQRYAIGDMRYNIPIHSEDEMGRLASSLNYMSNELNMSAEYERNFIANVSHDFRSPLTSIKGYVEAMLDGTIPADRQEKYLKIVLGETERLTKLTDGILTLNSMDRKKNYLTITVFDINTVIRDTAAAFEAICTPRHISIHLQLPEEPLYVSADMDKIQQVLYNLIDNAIKFSSDNSSVEIESAIRHEKVYISVRDHGVGIPRDSLNKIWERFYKTDVSRGREPKGNGLGLSIVKEILNQHGQNITAVSTEGVGTEFVFSLDLAPAEQVH